MKRTESLYRTAVLLLLLMLAAACTRDDTFDDAAPGNGIDPAAPLTITVTDGAYAPETSAANAATDDGAPVTRAVERDFATGFTAADRIGLYVMDAAADAYGNPTSDRQITVSNLCLTYDGTAWTLPDNAPALKHNPAPGRGLFYFAYYPYQQDMSGREPNGLNAESLPAFTAPEFFRRLINDWVPRGNQSTYAAYTASDLMVARGTVADRTDGGPGSLLSFTMEHQMLLNIVRLPHTTSTYTEEIDGSQQTKSCDIYTGACVPNFWMENHHTARLITNPSSKTEKITGCYYYDSGFSKRTFDIGIPNEMFLRGKYKTYTVDNATETKSERPLTAGDFYMNDGGIIPGDAFGGGDMPADLRAACLGVVFWAGEKTDADGDTYHWTSENLYGDRLLMHEHPGCTHGLVVALKDAAGAEIQWSSTDTEASYTWLKDYAAAGKEEEKDLILKSTNYYGYNMTRRLGWYRDAGGHPTEALDAVEQYARANATPDGCSGWYFPGDYEMTVMARGTMNYGEDLGMAATLNTAFTKAGGREFTDGYYWSSTDTELFPGKARCIRFSDKERTLLSKQEAHHVRAVLAF